ncbi:MAG: hypothetical protein ACREIS_05805 [Nitrospiraceae bacterium]
MSPSLRTAAQAAEAFYALMPHGVSPATLEEYGIDASPEQAQQIARELLSVNLYWISCALKAGLPDNDCQRVFGELRQRLAGAWESELGLAGHDADAYFVEMEQRRATYDQITQDGGPPVVVLSETAAILESAFAGASADRRKLLALLFDLVPADAYGGVLEEIELTG